MSATLIGSSRPGTLSIRKARWLLVAVHIAVIAVAPIQVGLGTPGVSTPPENAGMAFALALAILALQLRHSFAIARGERPRAAWATFLALVILVYVPVAWFGWYWAVMQVCVMASLPVVVRGRWWIAAAALPVVITDIANIVANDYGPHQPIGLLIYSSFFWAQVLVPEAAGLYGTARLVRLVEELQEAHAGLAESAIGRERLRISRDLHDLLGQSLSAIALKGDLAVRLLLEDAIAGRNEIDSLTAVARSSLRQLLAVSRDEHTVSLRSEIEGAAALLSAAGIDSQISLDLADLNPPLEDMLAWTVREGVANVLRHSQAQTCWITGGHNAGYLFLEIVNDGVYSPIGEGSGLRGLNERARAASGSAVGSETADGKFSLLVAVPEGQQ